MILCPEVTVQGLLVRDPAQAVVWVEAKVKAKVEAEWVDHLPQGQADNVSVHSAAKQCRTQSANPVTRRSVLSVVYL